MDKLAVDEFPEIVKIYLSGHKFNKLNRLNKPPRELRLVEKSIRSFDQLLTECWNFRQVCTVEVEAMAGIIDGTGILPNVGL
ncbi:hypothetical protein B6N60_05286 [Richelia sinica FACHB-800]|uniref:Uncharacterized protein n=1 Tax=Richelia sinica FACHB-800 TaxID=1357546 RepID=A0A975TD10_9NOST|nr:hypothetical protein [Richelia sinica]MBD2665559.1 hypothetical protein [Richelia sinica FACHB-800]QXE26553.1 hypothetical protein B6N60_05286 [Richelia sinica FACHB-800]